MTKAVTPAEHLPLLLHLRPAIEMNDQQFFEFCQINRELRIERTAEGDLLIMPPAGGRSGHRNARLTTQFGVWAEREGSGLVFDSSTGFHLPNGADRSPDVAWVRRERLAMLTDEEKEKFLPLCPDFALELRSPSDTRRNLKAKMKEYLDNGTRLGWLIDAIERRVDVYRPDGPVEGLEGIETLSGDPVLPGFVLDLRKIWDPDF
jgi:Uma2 family endonuclease